MPFRVENKINAKGHMMAETDVLRRQVAELEEQLRNISENHQQMTIKLLQERNRAQMYLDLVEVMLVALDNNGNITLINRKGCRILGYEYEEIIGKNWFETCIPPTIKDQVFQVFKQLMNDEIAAVEYYENPVITKNGKEVLIAWHNSILHDESGTIAGILSSGEDITQQKQYEEQLTTSLKEKELLLKEVHHRVKNNMAVISSLLNLQAHTFDDPAVKSAFHDSQHRIRSMALIHEKLYQSRDLSNIDFSEYIQDLAQQISRSNEFRNSLVQVKVMAEKINMGIDIAIPCGLISNELLTNALKYAFPLDQAGEIHIRVKFLSDKLYQLIVRDNGVGLPEHIDIQNPSTFGLNLVHLLTQQVEGTIAVDREKGTSFTITFPIPPDQ